MDWNDEQKTMTSVNDLLTCARVITSIYNANSNCHNHSYWTQPSWETYVLTIIIKLKCTQIHLKGNTLRWGRPLTEYSEEKLDSALRRSRLSPRVTAMHTRCLLLMWSLNTTRNAEGMWCEVTVKICDAGWYFFKFWRSKPKFIPVYTYSINNRFNKAKRMLF